MSILSFLVSSCEITDIFNLRLVSKRMKEYMRCLRRISINDPVKTLPDEERYPSISFLSLFDKLDCINIHLLIIVRHMRYYSGINYIDHGHTNSLNFVNKEKLVKLLPSPDISLKTGSKVSISIFNPLASSMNEQDMSEDVKFIVEKLVVPGRSIILYVKKKGDVIAKKFLHITRNQRLKTRISSLDRLPIIPLPDLVITQGSINCITSSSLVRHAEVFLRKNPSFTLELDNNGNSIDSNLTNDVRILYFLSNNKIDVKRVIYRNLDEDVFKVQASLCALPLVKEVWVPENLLNNSLRIVFPNALFSKLPPFKT